MQNYKDGVLEAYGLLQIDPEIRDDEWEAERKEWIEKWGEIIWNDAPNTPLNGDHGHGAFCLNHMCPVNECKCDNLD